MDMKVELESYAELFEVDKGSGREENKLLQ